MPVSFVKRWPISASFLSMTGAKLFQQRYETSRCCPRAGAVRVARIPARLAPVVVVRKRRRVIAGMTPPLAVGRRPARGRRRRFVFGDVDIVRGKRSSNITWGNDDNTMPAEEPH